MRNPANKQTNKHTKVIAISRFSRDNNRYTNYAKLLGSYAEVERKIKALEESLSIKKYNHSYKSMYIQKRKNHIRYVYKTIKNSNNCIYAQI